jgi:hypothetical protein
MDQLQLLMDYTTFHIGMYATLCTLLVSLLNWNGLKEHAATFRPNLFPMLGCFLIAAAFGGLVGSSIPYYKDFDAFSRAHLGPWCGKWIPALVCTHLEHAFFWAGILFGVCGLCKSRKTRK